MGVCVCASVSEPKPVCGACEHGHTRGVAVPASACVCVSVSVSVCLCVCVCVCLGHIYFLTLFFQLKHGGLTRVKYLP